MTSNKSSQISTRRPREGELNGAMSAKCSRKRQSHVYGNCYTSSCPRDMSKRVFPGSVLDLEYFSTAYLDISVHMLRMHNCAWMRHTWNLLLKLLFWHDNGEPLARSVALCQDVTRFPRIHKRSCALKGCNRSLAYTNRCS